MHPNQGGRMEIRERLLDYFHQHGWRIEEGETKTSIYKDRKPQEVTPHNFLEYSKRKRPLTIKDFVQNAKQYFIGKGYEQVVRNSIINPEKDTIFLVAGIQYLSDIFRGRKEGDGKKYFIPQPVIRTKYRDSVGEGSVSSFVNLSTAQVPSSLEDHLNHVDDWMNYLSTIGLNLRDFNLSLERSNGDDWAGFWANARGDVLTFSYGGLEIGDAGYLQIGEGPKITDVGFGLERVLWAVNKNKHFSDLIGPKPFSFGDDYQLLDSIRTATLIASSGLNREDNDSLRQFQIYLNNIRTREPFDLDGLVKHYYNFWENFIDPPKSYEQTFSLVRSELNRQVNLEMLRSLGFEKPPKSILGEINNDSDSFIAELINQCLVKQEDFR
jgi:hypothetical protein